MVGVLDALWPQGRLHREGPLLMSALALQHGLQLRKVPQGLAPGHHPGDDVLPPRVHRHEARVRAPGRHGPALHEAVGGVLRRRLRGHLLAQQDARAHLRQEAAKTL